MKEDKEIFLPDTTVKLETLKYKLYNVYDLEIIPKSHKYFLIGTIIILTAIIIKQKLNEGR